MIVLMVRGKSLEIRRSTLEDLPELNRILRASKGHWGYSKEYLDEFMEKLHVIEHCILNSHIFCAYKEEDLIGFFGFKKNDENKDELDFLFLDKPYIGKGFGHILWNSCLDTAKQLNIKNFVLNSEPNAEAFYLKLGCKRVDSKKSVISSETREIPILSYSILS